MSNFKIPVSAYLAKYMMRKFFQDNKGPFKIEEDTLLGKQFMSIIIDARKKDVLDKHIEHTYTIEVILSQDMMKRSPNAAKLVTINFFLDKVFKEDLIGWILSASFYGIRPYRSCKDFLAFYSIDENEYSHDAAYKLWQRWNNADYKKKLGQPRTKIRSVASVMDDGLKNAA
jgi:hypothetical protein